MIARVFRLWCFEWRKLLARRMPVAAFVAVALLALVAPWVGHVVDTAASLSRGQPGAVDAYRNGWTALSGAVSTARLFLVIVLLVLAGSSVAEEHAHGTLQALFLRPIRRTELLVAKALAMWTYAVALLAVAVAAAALGAELTRGLYDVVDPSYPDRLTHAFGDMWTYVLLATALTVAPLAAFAALGLLASVAFEHPGHATGVAIGALFILSAASGLSRSVEPFLFVTYLSAPFEVVRDLSEQISGARSGFAPAVLARSVLVPGLWAATFFAAAAWLLARRDIARG